MLLWSLLCTFLAIPSFGLRLSWWNLFTSSLVQLRKLEKLRRPFPQIDLSAGAVTLSSPEKMLYAAQQTLIEAGDPLHPVGSTSGVNGLVETPLLLAHQMGKRIVKKLPDSALLGVLVLIASELLQREVNTKFLRLPPIMRELVNSTALELDTKLEFLSSLQWDVDPFLRAEIENLQNQPLEIIDKFIVTEILPRVDKELSPYLSKLTGDPRRVSLITANIKDLIQSASVVLLFPGSVIEDSPPTITSTVMKSVERSVDRVGETVEEAIKDWNKIIQELGQIVKAESILGFIPESLGFNSGGMRQWRSVRPQLPAEAAAKELQPEQPEGG